MTESHIAELATRLGRRDAIIEEPQAVERLSKDFYWYSPILKRLLDDKRAEIIIQPQSVEEIRKILSFSFTENIPVTVRGSGTGNYGQAVPLEGGIVLDLAPMDRILAIESDGFAVCEPGARLEQSKSRLARRAGNCVVIPALISKPPLAAFSPVVPAVSDRLLMAHYEIIKLYAPSRCSRWSRNRGFFVSRATKCTKSSTHGELTELLPRSGWPWESAVTGRKSQLPSPLFLRRTILARGFRKMTIFENG
jgi:hypothetical protein